MSREVRHLGRTGVGPGQVAPFAPGDPFEPSPAHHPGRPAPADGESLALELTGHALGAVGRMRGVDLHHQPRKAPLVTLPLIAPDQRPGPGMEAAET